MVQSQLSAYRGSDPVWGFVALIRSELFTGEAAVGLDPRVRLFAVDGRIYLAEREDDVPVGTRLVNCGVLTSMQLARGAVQASGREWLARLFQRDATIDRDSVESTIESATEALLASIAQMPVGMPEVFPLRQHSAGIHHWFTTTAASEADEAIAADATPSLVEVAEPIVEPVVHAFPPPTPPVDFAEPEWIRPETEELALVQPTVIPQVVEPALTTPGLPKLAPLNSALPVAYAAFQQTSELTPTPAPPPSPVPTSTLEPMPHTFANGLPKLATTPISMQDLKVSMQDLKAAADPSEPWGATPIKMAAVQIWDLVDDLFEDGPPEVERVGGGPPQTQSRGWLRKKH